MVSEWHVLVQTFMERIKNTLEYLEVAYWDYTRGRSLHQAMVKRHGFDPATISQIAPPGMLLVSADFALDPSRLLPPNVRFIG